MYFDPEESVILTKEQNLKITSENGLKNISRKDGSVPKFLFTYEYEYTNIDTICIYANSLEEANHEFEKRADGEVEKILNVTRQKIEFEDPRQIKLEI